jgi:hypothetical protein
MIGIIGGVECDGFAVSSFQWDSGTFLPVHSRFYVIGLLSADLCPSDLGLYFVVFGWLDSSHMYDVSHGIEHMLSTGTLLS